MRDRTNKQLAEKLEIIKEHFNENGSVFELLTIVQERLNSILIEPPVKPESGGQFIKVWDSLPPIGKPVIIKTEYGKHDICYLRVENNNRLLWVNDMRPQHTDGSVIEWKEIE